MPTSNSHDRYYQSDHDLLIEINSRLGRLEGDLGSLTKNVGDQYVGKESFKDLKERHERLEKIVYGIISIPLVGFLMALVYLVWNQKP